MRARYGKTVMILKFREKTLRGTKVLLLASLKTDQKEPNIPVTVFKQTQKHVFGDRINSAITFFECQQSCQTGKIQFKLWKQKKVQGTQAPQQLFARYL